MLTAWSETISSLRVRSLQWSVGIFCTLVGQLMLVVPHQFSSLSFAPLQPYLPWLGAVYIAAGLGLIVAAALTPRPAIAAGLHLGAGALLMSLAVNFAASMTWTAVPLYIVLGVGTAAAGLLPDAGPRRSQGGELLAVVLSLCSIATGLLMLLSPGQFILPIYDPIRPVLHWYGLAFLGGGLILLAAHLRREMTLWIFALAHLPIVAIFLLYMAVVTVPNRGMTGLAFYGGFGAVLAILPLLRRWPRQVDTRSLRMRLGIAFVIGSTLPLTLATALITDREEQIVREQALSSQRLLATVISQEVGDFMALHHSAVEALAAQPALLSAPTAEQQARLRTVVNLYPNMFACALYDREGAGLARSDAAPPANIADQTIFLESRSTIAPRIDLRISATLDRPVVTFGAPLRSAGGQFSGLVICGVELSRLTSQIRQISASTNHEVYLVDDRGCLLVSRAVTTPQCGDVPAGPPVQALRLGGPGGAISYGEPTEELISGFARVPRLGWSVVVERPGIEVLQGVYTARELAMVLLLGIFFLALIAGVRLAHRLTAPLHGLAGAMASFSVDAPVGPALAPSVTEVDQLAEAFGHLQRRLADSVAALRTSEGRYRDIVETANEGIWMLDKTGSTLFANSRLARLLGRTEQELDGRLWTALVHPESYHVAAAAFGLRGRGTTGQYDIRFRHPLRDGIWALVSVSGRYDEQGRQIGTLAMLTDITERKRAEESQRFLVESSTRLGSFLDDEAALASTAELLVPSLADWCTIHVIGDDGAVRPAAALHRHQAGMEALREAQAQLPIEQPDHPLLLALQAGRPYLGGHPDPEVGPPDPALLALREAIGLDSCMVVPLIARERILGAITVATAGSGRHYDESDLALLELLARRLAIVLDNCRLYQEAQHAIRLREEFLSIASHELKTPLTSLLGYAELLQRRADRDDMSERDRRAIRTVREQAERLRRLIGELLDISRLQTGQLHLTREELDLVALVDASAADIQSTTTRHRILLHSGPDPVFVVGDRLRLEQVLGNLIQNAVKYSPGGGAIELWVGREHGQAIVKVIDYGIGIPADAHAQIFQRFYRAPNVSIRSISGLGVGLYLVKQIVTIHGGTVAVESREGKGSVFTIRLPLAPAPEADVQAPEGVESRGA